MFNYTIISLFFKLICHLFAQSAICVHNGKQKHLVFLWLSVKSSLTLREWNITSIEEDALSAEAVEYADNTSAAEERVFWVGQETISNCEAPVF